MSKKNSLEAKALRKEKVAAKRNAFSNPVEKPDDCLRHFGFIPNEDFFKHSSVAWNGPDMKLAMRSKANLIKCREEGLLKETLGRAAEDGFVFLSFFSTGDGGKNADMSFGSNKNDDIYYIYRPSEYYSQIIGELGKSEKEIQTHLPFFDELNTIMCPLSRLEELPEKGISKKDIIKWSRVDESVMPMNEKELDTLLANSNEVALRQNYVFNEDGLVIEEFAGNRGYEGETFYQPLKKDSSYEYCFLPIPFYLKSNGIAFGDIKASIDRNSSIQTPNYN
jgi:hypothetical protein